MIQQLIDALVLASIYVLFALGMSLAWGVLGVLNLAHGAVLMFSAYIAYVFANSHRLPLGVVLLVGLLVGGMLTACLEFFVFRRIRFSGADQEESETRIVIASLGVASVLVAIAAYYTKNAQFSINSSFVSSVYVWAGARVTSLQVIIFVVALALSSLLAVWLKRSRTGRAIRAIESDAEAASLMAISPGRMATLTMFVAGGLAGLAGVFLTLYLGATDPNGSSSLLTDAFAVIVIGGVGSIGGAAIGALLLAGLETVVDANTSGQWSPAIAFGFIIVVLLFKPSGLFTSSRMKVDRA